MKNLNRINLTPNHVGWTGPITEKDKTREMETTQMQIIYLKSELPSKNNFDI